MDADRLRAKFIKRQLQRALGASDTTFARRVAREFRRYVDWFNQSLPRRDKKHIDSQLSALESKVRQAGDDLQQEKRTL